VSQIIKNANFQGHLITAVSECAEDRVHNLIFCFISLVLVESSLTFLQMMISCQPVINFDMD